MQLTLQGDFITRIDDLVTAENNRHDAMVTQLALLREHVLEGRIANKRSRIAGKENEGGHHSQQITQVEQTESAPTLEQLANKMLLGQKLPCIKSIASRVAVHLLTRIIRDINSKGQGMSIDQVPCRHVLI